MPREVSNCLAFICICVSLTYPRVLFIALVNFTRFTLLAHSLRCFYSRVLYLCVFVSCCYPFFYCFRLLHSFCFFVDLSFFCIGVFCFVIFQGDLSFLHLFLFDLLTCLWIRFVIYTADLGGNMLFLIRGVFFLALFPWMEVRGGLKRWVGEIRYFKTRKGV